jgi:hypothetical protein
MPQTLASNILHQAHLFYEFVSHYIYKYLKFFFNFIIGHNMS